MTIVKNSWRPTKDEAGLQLIWKSIDRVLDTCVDGVKNYMDRNYLLRRPKVRLTFGSEPIRDATGTDL